MTLTTEQSRALVDAIAAAPTLEALTDLRRVATREHALDVHGSFLELLIELRQEKLARYRAAMQLRRRDELAAEGRRGSAGASGRAPGCPTTARGR